MLTLVADRTRTAHAAVDRPHAPRLGGRRFTLALCPKWCFAHVWSWFGFWQTARMSLASRDRLCRHLGWGVPLEAPIPSREGALGCRALEVAGPTRR